MSVEALSEAFEGRERYRSDRGLNVSMLPLLLSLPLTAAVGAAFLLDWLFEIGWYLIFIVPAFTAAAVGGIVWLTVKVTHCRNALLAGFIGLVSGTVGYLGYYHVGMAKWNPPKLAGRVDLLPNYIAFRMKTMRQVDPAQPDAPMVPRNQVDVGLNWFSFGMEFLVFALFGAGMGWTRARRAYSVEAGRWMARDVIPITKGVGAQLEQAFASGDMQRFVKLVNRNRSAAQQTPSKCILEYVRDGESSPLEHPVYLTVEDPKYQGLPNRSGGLRQVRLDLSEAVALRPLFAGLAAALGVAHEELRNVPETEEAAPAETVAVPRAVAEIEPVPEPYGGRVFTTGHKVMINVVALTPIVALLGGVGLCGWGGYLINEGKAIPAAAVMIAVGGIAAIGGIAASIWYNLWFEDVYSRWKFRRAVKHRPDPLVEADDDEALSIGITPRENWAKVKLEIASDLGLMKIDRDREEIRIEGDKDRYRIPGGAIASCAPEPFYHPLDQNTEHWLVRLVVHLPEGSREILFGVSHTDLVPRNNKRRRQVADECCARIRQLMAAQPAMGTVEG